MRFILGTCLTILLTGCTTTTTNYYHKTVCSWQGGDAKTLVQHWGRPDNILNASNGHSLYIYQSQSYRNMNAPSMPSIGVHRVGNGATLATTSNLNMTWNRGPMSTTCVAAFLVGPNGEISRTETHGSSCFGNQHFAQLMSNPTKKMILQ